MLGLLATTTFCFPPSLAAQQVIDLPGRDRQLDAEFEEVFRVGVLDGQPWEMLGGVRYAGFDANGNLYIVDGIGGDLDPGGDLETALRDFRAMMSGEGVRVLVFDASGNFVREFGSPGEGPGEFKWPSGYAVMRDGTMVVKDFGHRGYQLFGANGESAGAEYSTPKFRSCGPSRPRGKGASGCSAGATNRARTARSTW